MLHGNITFLSILSKSLATHSVGVIVTVHLGLMETISIVGDRWCGMIEHYKQMVYVTEYASDVQITDKFPIYCGF